MKAKTIAEKIWESHVVTTLNEHEVLLYIDLHLLHEINTPPAFDGLREKKIGVHRPDRTLSTEDHNTPTSKAEEVDRDQTTWTQISLLRENCRSFGIEHYPLGTKGQGITHVIAPEQGRVIPGMTLVCCDSHTTTHGAFGALAFGIGTSQVEHVLATQTLRAFPFKTLGIRITGKLSRGVSAKDLALAIIRKIGTGGGQGCVIEYHGEAIAALSMEQRMTLCNMSVEAGASAGIISPDEVTLTYLRQALGRRHITVHDHVMKEWLKYATDEHAVFDKTIEIDATAVRPSISWGTNPSQVLSLGESIPLMDTITTSSERLAAKQALTYMGLQEGENIFGLAVSNVFIGSCTNGRIEDLRVVADVLQKRKVHHSVHLLIVPGSMAVYQQAVTEKLDIIFKHAGADFRPLAGCSLCVGLNADRLSGKVRTVSTTNRNFEGRQGSGVRTHITSPLMAAISATTGCIAKNSDVEAYLYG